MGADLPNLFLEDLQILKGLGAAAGVPQNGGGVEQGHHVHPGLLKPLAVLLGDLEVGLDEPHGGDAAQTYDDLGPDDGHLVAQVADAGVLLRIQGITVLRRTALDHVGDVHVLFSAQVNDLQHVVQQLATPAHKGLSL